MCSTQRACYYLLTDRDPWRVPSLVGYIDRRQNISRRLPPPISTIKVPVKAYEYGT